MSTMLINFAARALLAVEVAGPIAGVLVLIVGIEVLRYQVMKKQEETKNA